MELYTLLRHSIAVLEKDSVSLSFLAVLLIQTTAAAKSDEITKLMPFTHLPVKGLRAPQQKIIKTKGDVSTL